MDSVLYQYTTSQLPKVKIADTCNCNSWWSTTWYVTTSWYYLCAASSWNLWNSLFYSKTSTNDEFRTCCVNYKKKLTWKLNLIKYMFVFYKLTSSVNNNVRFYTNLINNINFTKKCGKIQNCPILLISISLLYNCIKKCR